MADPFESDPFSDEDLFGDEPDAAAEIGPDELWEDGAARAEEEDPDADYEDEGELPSRKREVAEKIAEALGFAWGNLREYAKDVWENSRQTSRWSREARRGTRRWPLRANGGRKAALRQNKRGPWVDKNGKPTRPNAWQRFQDLTRYNRTGYGEPLPRRRGGPGRGGEGDDEPYPEHGDDDEPYPDPDDYFGGPEDDWEDEL